MNKYFLASVAAFLVVAGAYMAVGNASGSAPGALVFYRYELQGAEGGGRAADLTGVVTAYLFVALVSLLFFGMGGPIAMALEAAKYASLYQNSGMHAFGFAFAVPQLMAAYAAALLGEGILADYEHEGIVFKNWEASMVLFLGGLAFTLALFAVSGLVVVDAG